MALTYAKLTEKLANITELYTHFSFWPTFSVLWPMTKGRVIKTEPLSLLCLPSPMMDWNPYEAVSQNESYIL